MKQNVYILDDDSQYSMLLRDACRCNQFHAMTYIRANDFSSDCPVNGILVRDLKMSHCDKIEVVVSGNKPPQMSPVRETLSQSIAKTYATLAKMLHMQKVAEGVQDETTWQLLYGLRGDLSQGACIGKPLNRSDIETGVRFAS